MKRIMLMVIFMIALSAAIGCNTKTKSSSKTDADWSIKGTSKG